MPTRALNSPLDAPPPLSDDAITVSWFASLSERRGRTCSIRFICAIFLLSLLLAPPSTQHQLLWTMKFSTALVALAAVAGGTSAFQSPALTAGRTLSSRIAGENGSALMAATLDSTAAGAVALNGKSGARRKKTKQVSVLRGTLVAQRVSSPDHVYPVPLL